MRLARRRKLVGAGVGNWCAHADFTKQKVWAFKPSVVLSSFSSSSTKMRQVMVLPSPWATMLGAADGSVVSKVSDHGRAAPSTRWGLASRSR